MVKFTYYFKNIINISIFIFIFVGFMRKKARGELVEGTLERVSACNDAKNAPSHFHTSMFRSAFEGLRSKFKMENKI